MSRLGDGEDLSIATPEDFGIRRGEDGELLPIKQRVPGTEHAIRCIPLTGGKLDEYNDVLERGDADEERIAQLLREHIVEGIGAEATAEKVTEEYPGYLIPGLLQALKDSSGHSVFLETQARRNEEVKANAELVEAVGGIERIEELAALDDEPQR